MEGLIIGIITGILAGFIASKLQSGTGKGLLLDLFLGIIGGMFGGWLFSLLGISVAGWLGELVCAVVGAVIILWVVSKMK